MWLFQCDCGARTTAVLSDVTDGHTKSCGCLSLKTLVQRSTTHGLARRNARSPEYRSWCAMRTRSRNKNTTDYENCGGRGVSICERWNDFENFLADMGPKPSPLHMIDRIDNDGNYERDNCRWATPLEQANNTRRNVFITTGNRTLSLAVWAREIDFPYKELRALVDFTKKGFAKTEGTALTAAASARRSMATL